jgi:hypothetical protein
MAHPAALHQPRWRMIRSGGSGPYHRVCLDCPPHQQKSGRPRHEHWPAVLDRQTLRGASDDELVAHFAHHGDNMKTHKQVLDEMARRDRAERAAERKTARKFARWEEVERQIAAAEHATNGYMVNAAGRAKGITEWQLFTGRERDAWKYSTEELKAFWERNPRPTARNLSAAPTARQRSYRATDRFLAAAH